MCLKSLNGSSLFSASTLPSACPTLCWKGIHISVKIRVLASGDLSQTLDPEILSSACRSRRLSHVLSVIQVRPTTVVSLSQCCSNSAGSIYRGSVVNLLYNLLCNKSTTSGQDRDICSTSIVQQNLPQIRHKSATNRTNGVRA